MTVFVQDVCCMNVVSNAVFCRFRCSAVDTNDTDSNQAFSPLHTMFEIWSVFSHCDQPERETAFKCHSERRIIKKKKQKVTKHYAFFLNIVVWLKKTAHSLSQ